MNAEPDVSTSPAVTLDDYFGRHIERPSAEVAANALELLARVNALLSNASTEGIEAAQNPKVNSGWRPASYNATIPNAAARSKHITGQAIDLADPEGVLDDWCVQHLESLEAIGLWLEHPLATKNWCHLQSIPPKSGKRIFYP